MSAKAGTIGAWLALLGCLALGPGAAARILLPVGDQVNISAVAIEGRTAEACNADLLAIAEQGQVLSDATSPPVHLSPNLRAFHDNVLRLSANGEARSMAQLSHAYVARYSPAREPIRASVVTFLRVEVARPPGTPPGAPARIAVTWTWLQRLAEARDPATGLAVAQPFMHRFDFLGEVVLNRGVWGHATAACRAGGDGMWFGAVLVWTFLAP